MVAGACLEPKIDWPVRNRWLDSKDLTSPQMFKVPARWRPCRKPHQVRQLHLMHQSPPRARSPNGCAPKSLQGRHWSVACLCDMRGLSALRPTKIAGARGETRAGCDVSGRITCRGYHRGVSALAV